MTAKFWLSAKECALNMPKLQTISSKLRLIALFLTLEVSKANPNLGRRDSRLYRELHIFCDKDNHSLRHVCRVPKLMLS